MPMSKKIIVLMAISSVGLGGCATKGYVNDNIAMVNQRIDGLDTRLRTVEGTANAAKAGSDANAAQAQNTNARLDQLTGRVDSIDQRLMQRKRARN